MKWRREREEGVKSGLVQGVAHGMPATHEIEVSLTSLERPGEAQNGTNAPEVDEVQRFQVDGYGFGPDVKPLLKVVGEADSIGCVHPALGPGDEALPFFLKLDLHRVVQAPGFGIHAVLCGWTRA
jgi:hypothetical protein